MEVDSKKFASVVARMLDDKLASNITILEISHVSSLGDYFVIASADSPTQVKSLMSHAKEMMKKHFERLPIRAENDIKNRWNLLDYGDVIVHIFNDETRLFYHLERLWMDGANLEKFDDEKGELIAAN